MIWLFDPVLPGAGGNQLINVDCITQSDVSSAGFWRNRFLTSKVLMW